MYIYYFGEALNEQLYLMIGSLVIVGCFSFC